MQRMGSVYLLIDPGSRKVRYVGANIHEPRTRLSQHMSIARMRAARSGALKGGSVSRFYWWLRRLDRAGKKPRIKLVATVVVADLGRAESLEIEAQEAAGASLYNVHRYRYERGQIKAGVRFIIGKNAAWTASGFAG